MLTTVNLAAADDTWVDESRLLAQTYGRQLKAELEAAMVDGGPVKALGVCKDRAPQIASELSRRSGAKVTRTSRRFRNPGNAPEPWQVAVLASFESAPDATLPELIEQNDDGRRYMKAIRIQPVCLVCHGQSLAENVRAMLDEQYPHDRARGYAIGDLRGAFSISWPVPGAGD